MRDAPSQNIKPTKSKLPKNLFAPQKWPPYFHKRAFWLQICRCRATGWTGLQGFALKVMGFSAHCEHEAKSGFTNRKNQTLLLTTHTKIHNKTSSLISSVCLLREDFWPVNNYIFVEISVINSVAFLINTEVSRPWAQKLLMSKS